MARLPWVDEKKLAKAHPRLFHYTRAAVLQPILTSGGMFATHYSKTNDRQEMRALREVFVKRMFDDALPLVRERLSRGDIILDLPEDQFEPMLWQDANTFFEIMVRKVPQAPHITCFSPHDAPHHQANGLLTMWRLYGGTGEGIALGFNTQKLVGATERILRERAVDMLYLDRVGYGLDDPQTVRRIEEAATIPRLFATFVIATFERRKEIPMAELEDLFGFLVLCASSKHPDFSDEREVRLVVREALPASRHGRVRLEGPRWRLLVPYLDALEEVLVGPSNQQAALFRLVKQTLKTAGFTHVPVRKSETPYRHI